MPQWIHDRAQHLMRRNPEMPESEAWAIATQQSHATGHSPKGYGTAEGRQTAKKKFDTPSDDVQTADPKRSTKDKTAEVQYLSSFVESFADELTKIGEAGDLTQSLGTIKSTVPKNPLNSANAKYSKVVSQNSPSPASAPQPVLAPPPVRT